jgi:hypothetical protein
MQFITTETPTQFNRGSADCSGLIPKNKGQLWDSGDYPRLKTGYFLCAHRLKNYIGISYQVAGDFVV